MSNEFASEFEDAGAAVAAPDLLARITTAAKELIAQQEMIDQMEEDLKAAKAGLQTLSTKTLPDLMTEAAMSSTTIDGYKIDLAPFYSGSLPKPEDARQKAIAWLEANDGGGLIKSTLSIEFGRSQHNVALDLCARLIAEEFPAMLESGVHPQTLLAFVRERVASGAAIDLDVLGVYTGQHVKAKKVAEKRGKKS